MSSVPRRRRMEPSRPRRPFTRSRNRGTSRRSLASLRNGMVVVDLTCEALEPPVVDLTNNDSVVLVDEISGSPADRGAGSESYVLSSDEEEERTQHSRAAVLSALQSNSITRSTPGTISCPICLDTYCEIVGSRRLVVSTKCGHLFCSQCLRDSLVESHTCPTCRKRLTNKQYHPIYI